jgi:hypothetical protein
VFNLPLRVDIPKGIERALLVAQQIVDDKAPDVPIEAAKIVGTLSQQALDTHTFGFARLIVICSFDDVATMLHVVL